MEQQQPPAQRGMLHAAAGAAAAAAATHPLDSHCAESSPPPPSFSPALSLSLFLPSLARALSPSLRHCVCRAVTQPCTRTARWGCCCRAPSFRSSMSAATATGAAPPAPPHASSPLHLPLFIAVGEGGTRRRHKLSRLTAVLSWMLCFCVVFF